MQNERLEFFKLDPTDRKVLFWLMDNVDLKSLKGWMEYIARDYREIQSTNDDPDSHRERIRVWAWA